METRGSQETPDYSSRETWRAALIPTVEEDRWDQGELPNR
jgi:hypothetical protein